MVQVNKEKTSDLYIGSLEVAEMTGKRHADLLRTIDNYMDVLEFDAKLRSSNFFIKSTYQDNLNRMKPCYLLTRKGCDMVANKMTGEKGILFTATYVSRFEEMENQLKEQGWEDFLDSEGIFFY